MLADALAEKELLDDWMELPEALEEDDEEAEPDGV
jgi:hypothetical protein